nr:signal peptidase I [Plantactinospora alkalitolerans]
MGIAVAVAVAVLLLRRTFVVVTVSGESMLPTLRPGDRVLVRRVPLRRVRRGQLVVIESPARGLPMPENPPWLVKRAVALPGEPVPSEMPALPETDDGRVPADRFVILGDNILRSFDSRRAGYFSADTLLGVVVRRMSSHNSSDGGR